MDILLYKTLQSTALPTELSRVYNILPSMRIELTTLGLLDPRSNQLSYEGFKIANYYYIYIFFFIIHINITITTSLLQLTLYLQVLYFL